MNKNYYTILGVAEDCTEQDIKSAYRRLARKWHPDIAGNSESVIEKFKEINEAYEVLSNKIKKEEYDRINRYYNYSSKKSEKRENAEYTTNPEFKNTYKEKKPENNQNNRFSFNWEEILSKYKDYAKKYSNRSFNEENKNQTKNGCAKRGNDINTDVEVTIAESINGVTKVINMISTSECSHCNGRKFINGALCKHCNGSGETSEYRRFTVKIPAGVKDNSKIRLSGEGEKGQNGGKNGDLYITVHIKEAVDYTTDGNNIIKHITLAPYEAVLGGNIKVKTFDGNINVKISPNTQNGQKIRLNGCGINVNGRIGDMILVVEIQIPQNISDSEIELYKKLRDISKQSIR